MMTCIGFLIFFQCGNPAPVTVDAFCQTARVIVLSAADIRALSLSSKRQIAAHNVKIRRLCK
jgi:hypothetical protein